MPKKTRQEKILAQLKRLQQQQSNQFDQNNKVKQEPETTVKVSLKSLEIEGQVVSSPQKQVDFDYSHVSKDLRKSLIFAVVAIVFEILLSRIS